MPDIYEELRERLDMFAQGFPRTESGVEMEILRELFYPEEARCVHRMRPLCIELSDGKHLSGSEDTGRSVTDLHG